jgi:hypothetical protein
MISKRQILSNVGSTQVRTDPVTSRQIVDSFGEQRSASVLSVLEFKNGFYAFEGALHVFSDLGTKDEYGIIEWNSDDLWRRAYAGMAEDCVFFAEDIFGVQFCVRDGGISSFEPETGRFEHMARTVEEWAEKILEDYELWTGHRVASEWQQLHGPLPMGLRLVPKTPFVLGGDYAIDNMHALEAAKAMRFRASIAVQIRDLPDGTPVELRVVD